MDYTKSQESPFQIKISFHRVLENLEQIANSKTDYRSGYSKLLLKKVEKNPELREGITELDHIEKHKDLINEILSDVFPATLTHHDIKAAAIPFHNITFSPTEKLKKILEEAGSNFDIVIQNFDEHQFYIMSCCMILNLYYGQNIDYKKPLFYDIPDKEGILRHYQIIYNPGFIELLPTEKSVHLKEEDIKLLLDNYENLKIWKEKFPPGSWILKGFGIVQLFDATTENAISRLKTGLLQLSDEETEPNVLFEEIFRSIFKVPDLHIGFTSFLMGENQSQSSNFTYEKRLPSYTIHNSSGTQLDELLSSDFLMKIKSSGKPMIISDIKLFRKDESNTLLISNLGSQNIQSCILAPIIKDGNFFGILELVSSIPYGLNSINAKKLIFIMPFIIDTIDRYNSNVKNKIEAIIQKEYTSIHPSVYWRFQEEALKYIVNAHYNPDHVFKDILFQNVYPLYGQIDVKESSTNRNRAIFNDLVHQLQTLIALFDDLSKDSNLMILQQRKYELIRLKQEVQENLKTDTEQKIQHYLESVINPILKNSSFSKIPIVLEYFEKVHPETTIFYEERQKFDTTLALVNEKLSLLIDSRQKEAQEMFSHYFERFNTDGIEHNLYIGNSISQKNGFSLSYLHNLRLWQLSVLAQMIQKHNSYKNSLPYPLEVTGLILVMGNPITIRFRMDEKRFDVDGSYNARYEVIKKRIDKALEKNTNTRITQVDKITIVYSQLQEEKEYKKYINYLQFQKILNPSIEHLEIEDLQGVSGLKAMRVSVTLD